MAIKEKTTVFSVKESGWMWLTLLVLMLASLLVYKNNLIDGVIIFKQIWFLYFAGIALLFLSLYKYRYPSQANLNSIDFTFITLQMYLIIHNLMMNYQLTLRGTFENIGLVIFYFFARNYRQPEKTVPVIDVVLLLFTFIHLAAGYLQLLNIIPSFNDHFRITGFLFNPGPNAVLLSALIAYCLVSVKLSQSLLFRTTGWVICISGLLLIIISQSRTAWVSCSFTLLCYLGIVNANRVKLFFSKKGHVRYLLSVFIILGVIGIAYLLFLIKKDSFMGRLLVWRVSFEMIKKHFLFGMGQDGFRINFLSYQGSYFKSHPAMMSIFGSSSEQVYYAFNDYLQIAVEQGIVGLLLFVTLIYKVITSFLPAKKTSIPVHKGMRELSAITVIIVSAIFTYSFVILPIRLLLIFMIGQVSNRKSNMTKANLKQYLVDRGIGWTIGCCMGCVLGICMSAYAVLQYKAYKQEYIACSDIMIDSEAERLLTYQSVLCNDSWYITLKSSYLLRKNKTKDAIVTLETGINECPIKNFYYSLGNLFMYEKNYHAAEEQYLVTYYALPGLLRPKYLLAKLYLQSGQTAKWLDFSAKVVKFKPKVRSADVDEMKAEITSLLVKK